MDHFNLRDGELHCEDVPLARIAGAVGTPVYVYSRATLERHARVFREALSGLGDPWIAFALKSNPNLAVLRVLGRQGFGAAAIEACTGAAGRPSSTAATAVEITRTRTRTAPRTRSVLIELTCTFHAPPVAQADDSSVESTLQV